MTLQGVHSNRQKNCTTAACIVRNQLIGRQSLRGKQTHASLNTSRALVSGQRKRGFYLNLCHKSSEHFLAAVIPLQCLAVMVALPNGHHLYPMAKRTTTCTTRSKKGPTNSNNLETNSELQSRKLQHGQLQTFLQGRNVVNLVGQKIHVLAVLILRT